MEEEHHQKVCLVPRIERETQACCLKACNRTIRDRDWFVAVTIF